ncbi:hypothetical protein F5877DRAFT_72449 [Lentinula edodes]|nr:hypothetical protein F5877DRAFT_72449 [Lentinula edodes]
MEDQGWDEVWRILRQKRHTQDSLTMIQGSGVFTAKVNPCVSPWCPTEYIEPMDKIRLNTSLVVFGIIFAQNGIYSLPNSFQEFINLVKNCIQRPYPERCFDNSQLLEYQGEYIGNNMFFPLHGEYIGNNMFFPLHVFCLITPLFILRPCNLTHNLPQRDHVLHVMRALAPKHPESLVKIKTQWINKIITIVKAEKTVEEVLLEFSEENLSFENISTKDASFFKLCNFCNSLSSAINLGNESTDTGQSALRIYPDLLSSLCIHTCSSKLLDGGTTTGGTQPPLIPVIGDEGQIAGHKRTRNCPEYPDENSSIIADTEHPNKSQRTDSNQCSPGTSSARTPEHGSNISHKHMHTSTPTDNWEDEQMITQGDEEEDELAIQSRGPVIQDPERPSPDDVEDEPMIPGSSDEEDKDRLAIQGHRAIQLLHKGPLLKTNLLKLVGETSTWSPNLSNFDEKLIDTWINEDMFTDEIQSPTGKKGLHEDEPDSKVKAFAPFTDLPDKSTLEDIEAIISKVHQTASTDGEHLGSVSELRTLHDATLLEESELKKDANKNPRGEILNCLDLPLSPDHFPPPRGLSTDSAVRQRLNGYFTHCKQWGLAATAYATHKGHVDVSGYATYVQVLVGKKYWIVGCPRTPGGFGSIDSFRQGYEADLSNSQQWAIHSNQLFAKVDTSTAVKLWKPQDLTSFKLLSLLTGSQTSLMVPPGKICTLS